MTNDTVRKFIVGAVCVAMAGVVAGLAGARSGALGVKVALDAALADERHSRAFYEAVMAKHGRRRPFSNIVNAERRHAAALLAQYERLGLTPPEDEWAVASIDVPGTFREACDASIVAEVRNVRLYDDLLERVRDEDVRAVFERLRWASLERHLRAFRRHGSGWGPVDAAALDDGQVARRDRALAARDAMFGALMTELSGALAEGGPTDAIAVCSTRAPAIAAGVAAEHGVKIGRTSWKLRNPGNRPPIWTELLVDERVGDTRLMADRSGRLGVLAPIRIAPACLKCHGGPGDLAAGVPEELGRLYPEDEATGFREGDLRGWFWVEVPPAAAASSR